MPDLHSDDYSSLSRREREHLRHKEAILEAALDLFAEKGYVNVTMHEIAERAEFATGTLYNFFDHKEGLYKALITSYIDSAHAVLLKALQAGGDEVDSIIRFVRAKSDIFKEHVSFIRLYVSETRGLGFVFEKGLLKEKIDSVIDELASVFERGIEKGLFRDYDPYYLAISLNGLSSVFLIHMLEDRGRITLDSVADNVLSIFFSDILIEKGRL